MAAAAAVASRFYILIQLLFRIAILGHGLGALVLIALALLYFLFTPRRPPRAQLVVGPGQHRHASRAGGWPSASAASRRRPPRRPRRTRRSRADVVKPRGRACSSRSSPRGTGRPGRAGRLVGAGPAGRVGAPPRRPGPPRLAQPRRGARRADHRLRRPDHRGDSDRQRHGPGRGKLRDYVTDHSGQPPQARRPAHRYGQRPRVLDAGQDRNGHGGSWLHRAGRRGRARARRADRRDRVVGRTRPCRTRH